MSPTALKGRSGLLRLSLLSLAIGAGPACAQDSGVGVDLQFGNALNPAGKLDHGCDPDGFTWLAGESKRTPTGFLYACPPATPDYVEDGDWLTRATFQLGYLSVSGDENAMQWRRFSNWDDGMTLGADLRFEHPADGRYFEFHGSMLDEYSQYYRALYGKAGKYRVQAFVRTQPNVTSGNARSIWDGVGSQHLTLKPPLTPSTSTSAQVAAVSAAEPESTLRVVRDKQGLGVTYFFDKRWTGYFNGSHESRKGARPFGGPFFFNYPFANNGGAYEIPRPIDDSTVNLNGGLRFVGNLWRMEFGYSGSYFRNAYKSYDYQIPMGTAPVIPGLSGPQLGLGEFSYEPDNDYHQLRASFSRKIAWNGDFSLTASLSRSSQNDDLVAPMNCQGQFGIPLPGMLYDCANWNTTAALSRTKADLAINGQLLDARIVLQPTDSTTWRASARFQRDDYAGTYWAYNPLTGQYGYISENGAQGSVVPGEMGVWDPNGNASVLTRVRNLPLDKEVREASTGIDWRLGAKNTVGATYTFTRTERAHREVAATDDGSLKLNWTNRALDWLTLRVNYTYLKRSGSEYEYDPYEFTFSESLPGYVAPATGTMAHTVEELRKYDVSSRDQNKLDVMATFILPHEMTLYASVRGDWNDYDAILGRQKYDTLGGSLQWEWQPRPGSTGGAWYGYDRSKLAFANVNDGVITDNPSLGGPSYPDANRWWVDDKQRNHYAGANWSQRIGRATLDGSWNWTYSRGITAYRFASPAALTAPALAPLLAGEYPPMIYRSNSYTLSLSFPLAPRVGVRLFDTYEKAVLSDWHYLGFENGQVIDHRVYTDGGPESYRVNLVGVLLEIQL